MSMTSKPMGMAIHRIPSQQYNNRILVTDYNNSRILIVKLWAPTITPWGSSGSAQCGQYSNPSDIAVHYATRNIFVADTGNDRIHKFRSSTSPITLWPCQMWGGGPGSAQGQFKQPAALTIDQSTGDVYVSDRGNNRIQKFDEDGHFIHSRNNLWASGMAVDSEGYLYISLIRSNKVYKLTPELQTNLEWGSTGNADGQFHYPRGIAVDHKNYIYVIDSGNFRVQKFTQKGEHVNSWGNYGDGDGQFKVPHGISYDVNSHRLNVSDSILNRIQLFTEDGIFIDKRYLP